MGQPVLLSQPSTPSISRALGGARVTAVMATATTMVHPIATYRACLRPGGRLYRRPSAALPAYPMLRGSPPIPLSLEASI